MTYSKLITAPQVDDITANRCMYLKSNVRSKLLEHIRRLLPPQSSKSRGVTWLGRCRIELENPSAAAAEYYIDNILFPVSLKKVIPLLPEDTVLFEMIPYSVSQSVIAKSLKSTMTVISLCKRGQKNTVQDFLEGIGDFYNIGFQPQVSRLYPLVQFPVSLGTPMISSLVRYVFQYISKLLLSLFPCLFYLFFTYCRWDHSEDYYLYHYRGQHRIFSREMCITITTADEEYEYLSGHMIDGKNLLPATAYLYLIWYMTGLLSGIDFSNIPIVFENVKFLRAIHLSKKDKVELLLLLQQGKSFHSYLSHNSQHSYIYNVILPYSQQSYIFCIL